MGNLDQSDAKHKYSIRSIFLLTPLPCNAKLCGSNEMKVIPIHVSDIQYLLSEEASQR